MLDQALAIADWDGFDARARSSEKRGFLRGRGLACHIDSTSGLAPSETVTVTVDVNGRCEFRSGTQEMGQGLHSTYLGIAASVLGLPLDAIDVIQGDTARVGSGIGSYGSRSLTIGGAAIAAAAAELIVEARRLGARMLNVREDEVGYAAGVVATADGAARAGLGAIVEARRLGAATRDNLRRGFRTGAILFPQRLLCVRG
jgi:carbon-monoxide dehydrogenase large subunit